MKSFTQFLAAIILIAGFLTLTGNAGQHQPAGSSHAIMAKSSPAALTDDQQALRDDLKKMRSLLQQMQTNLAFVDNTSSPLKHQFELEIDMWRMTIDQMERRLQPAAH